jgi:hypothetical protein
MLQASIVLFFDWPMSSASDGPVIALVYARSLLLFHNTPFSLADAGRVR